MRLKRLRLVGFKSFPDRTDLELDHALTCVVGPNGCGKSNIVDAVRWVLGEQSAKQLRGREMSDLIFNGSPHRKPTGYAEVSLTLDNSDRTLPVEFDEVVITRRLYRSGESEYLLNQRPCRLRDLRQLLAGTGLGVNAYSIIEQGKVDVLLTASAKERRVVFEEAAGIRQFRLQRHQCELKLQRTEQNLLRLGDIIEEVERQLRSLKYQAAKARRYKEYTQRLRRLKARLFLGDYRRLRSQVEQLEGTLTEVASALEELDRRRRAVETDLAEHDRRLADLEGGLRAVDRQQAELAAKLSAAEEAARQHRRTADSLNAQALHHRRQADDATGKLRSTRARCQQLQEDLSRLTTALERARRTCQEAQAELERHLARLRTHSQLLEREKTKAIDLLRSSARVQNKLGSLEGLCANLQAQSRRHHQRREHLLQRAQQLRQEHRRLEEEHRRTSSLLEDHRRRLAELKEGHRRFLERRNAAQAELAHLRQRLSLLVGRRDLLAGMERRLEGVAETVRRLLELARGRPGVFGLLADLLRVRREYAAAIEAALGEAADYLVVDTPRTAHRLLGELLRSSGERDPDRLGRVGFVCCEGVGTTPAGPPPEAILSHPGYVGLADDLVESAPVVRRALSAMLAETVVVRDLTAAEEVIRVGADPVQVPPPGERDALTPLLVRNAVEVLFGDCRAVEDVESAAAVIYRVGRPTGVAWSPRRAVTLSGEVVLADGRLVAVVGGGVASALDPARPPALTSAGRIFRRSELEHLQRRITELSTEVEARECECARTDQRIKRLEEELAELGARCDRMAMQLVRLASEQRRLEEELRSTGEESTLLETELQSIEEELAQARTRREELLRRRGDLEAEHLQLKERIARGEEEMEAIQEELARRREALTRAKVSLAETEARNSDLQRNLQAAEQDLQAWEEACRSAEEAAHSALQQAQRAAQQAEEAEREADRIRQLQARNAQERQTLDSRRSHLAQLRDRLLQERRQLAEQREQLLGRRQELEVHLGQCRVKLEDLCQRTREELGVELSALEDEEGQPTTRATPDSTGDPSADGGENLEALRAEIAELKTKIDRLGGVNLDALDELEQLEARAAFLNKQRDDLLKAKADLQRLIRRINHRCRELFTRTFEEVRAHFQELFRKLFGGGRADILLEPDESGQVDVLESGIEIIARPPGKEAQVLSLLSGGEKVLTAVALLLAIFRSNPSPFCFLDEVDAALDESAIGRFVEVLREFLDRSQFVVVTHNKRTMAAAEVLYGVTMAEPGVSRVVTVRLEEVERRAYGGQPTSRVA